LCPANNAVNTWDKYTAPYPFKVQSSFVQNKHKGNSQGAYNEDFGFEEDD
jgi:hypothetical protein